MSMLEITPDLEKVRLYQEVMLHTDTQVTQDFNKTVSFCI